MISRNTTVPTSKTEIFSTAADNQTQVDIHITQGERPMTADNKSLGRFILDGIPPAPRGVPQIEVAFDIDASGILKVTAKDKATDKSQDITITGAIGLSDDEVKRMQDEAEKHKEEDEKKAEQIKAKNQADAMVATAEKALKDAGDKVEKDIKEKVKEKITSLKEIMDKGNKEEIEKKTQELSEELQKIGQAMYGAAGSPEAGAQKEGKKGKDKGSKKKGTKEEKDGKVEEGEIVE